MSIYEQYEIVVGLEIHVQLQTASKIFSPDAATFGALPNENTNYISLAHPGTLPYTNRKILEYAIQLGIATNCTITERNEFSRKNYFYADLPKGYQISQFATPICRNGYLDIIADGQEKRIGITEIHLEEDAGKSIHDQNDQYSYIDLNRAGVPLLEIVSEPDLRSPEEAYQYLAEIRRIVTYLGICDGNMEEGSMRCDANVSVRRKGDTQLGERTEVKNMNSLRYVKRAIAYEAHRQIDLLEKGEAIVRQTRSFDAAKGTTFELRSKELAHDYRYFPEPDLPPFVITAEDIAHYRLQMPALPAELRQRYTSEFALSTYDAEQLTEEKDWAVYFEQMTTATTYYKAAANWLLGPVRAYLNKENKSIANFTLPPTSLARLVDFTETSIIGFSAAAQNLFPALLEQPEALPAELARQLDLLPESNNEQLQAWIDAVLAANPAKVSAYKKGQKGLLGFFMGEVMRQAKGKAEPQATQSLLLQTIASLP